MTINQHRFEFESLRRFAETVRGITQLPGIPTATWAAQAAVTMSRLIPGGLAAVRLMEVTPAGECVGTLCAGAYDARGSSEIEPGLLTVDGESLAAWWLLSTAKAAALNGLPISGTLRQAPGCDRWEFSTLGRRWSSMDVIEVWVGAKSFGKKPANEHGLWAVVELGDRSGEGNAEALRAAMPELAQRAGLAFSAAGVPEGEATLTQREHEVLMLLARGRTVKQIAEMLSRSPHTVHDHVKALHRKLGASSRGELVARALGHIDTQGNLVTHETDEPEGTPEARVSKVAPLG